MRRSISPDHKAAFLSIELKNKFKRGPGMWKFNNTLLEDGYYKFIYFFTIRKYLKNTRRLWINNNKQY